MSDERRSTVSKTVLPVGESTRELYAAINQHMEPGFEDELMGILADADARDPFAVSNLLYAWRTGQLA
jgi:hypothetical protein